MIETKSKTHTVRLFADRVFGSDLLKPVLYCGYHGDISKVPWYYAKHKGTSCETDLTLSEDELLGLMKSNTRNEIRRAEREGCTFGVTQDIDRFVSFYNAFCQSKGLNDFANRARLEKYGNLLLTEVRQGDTVLAMHANLLDKKSHTALLILSCSQRLGESADKKLIGWGNRFLHFAELKYLKAQGYARYDWSGIVLDPNDPRYSIGQFKLAFGGAVIDSWTLKSPPFRLLESVRSLVVKFRK